MLSELFPFAKLFFFYYFTNMCFTGAHNWWPKVKAGISLILINTSNKNEIKIKKIMLKIIRDS